MRHPAAAQDNQRNGDKAAYDHRDELLAWSAGRKAKNTRPQ
jgi:hypothetical protein